MGLKRKYTRDEFCSVSNARAGTYAEELVHRIYDALIFYARDLRAEYKKYYEAEYKSFDDFLYWKCEIPDEITQGNLEDIDKYTFIAISSDFGLFSTNSSDDIAINVIKETLSLLGENDNEDTN